MSVARTPPASPFFKVMGDTLDKLISKAVKAKSFSVTGDVQVLELRGVTKEGESFVIDHVEARLGRAAQVKVTTAPAGKLRLASVNGEAR